MHRMNDRKSVCNDAILEIDTAANSNSVIVLTQLYESCLGTVYCCILDILHQHANAHVLTTRKQKTLRRTTHIPSLADKQLAQRGESVKHAIEISLWHVIHVRFQFTERARKKPAPSACEAKES
jgi:hypothetical protein